MSETKLVELLREAAEAVADYCDDDEFDLDRRLIEAADEVAIYGLDRSRPAAALEDVRAERQRQIEAEGWTPEHDDTHGDGALAAAAGCYALHAALQAQGNDQKLTPSPWPWDDLEWNPSNQRRNLVKAGALILAEIERLDRGDGTANE